MAEIRAISRGLSLPDLERLGLREVVQRALDAHPGQDGRPVLDYVGPEAPALGLSARLCVYRFLQEGLSNAARHAGGAPATVEVRVGAAAVTARVRDEGPGFDPAAVPTVRPDGGEGLAGLRDRAESIGGVLEVDSAPGAPTVLTLTLPLEGGEAT
jgi:signal transduction histidine kinase